jgi:hypothetical protein
MKIWHRRPRWLVLLVLGVAAIPVVLLVSGIYVQSLQPFLATLPFSPKPPLSSQENHFPCLEAEAKSKANRRYSALYGPDWKIELAIIPTCLPERELILSTEEGRQFLRHPVKRRIAFWVTNKGDLTYVKVWTGSASEELNAAALELVTNHKCKYRGNKNCRIQSTWREPP